MGPVNVTGISIIVNGSIIKSDVPVTVPKTAKSTYVVVTDRVAVVIYDNALV